MAEFTLVDDTIAEYFHHHHIHRRRKIKKSTESDSSNISVLVNQLVFVTLCSRNFLEEEERATSIIYGLLFCHLITYCITYIKELVERKDWDMSVRIAPNSNVKHLGLTAINIGLEWTKAITFLVTIICFFLILGAEQDFRLGKRPTLIYLSLTLTYYVLSEPRVQSMMPNVLTRLPNSAEKIQGLEKIYSKILIKGVMILMNICLLVPLLTQIKLTLITLISNIYRPWKLLKAGLHELKSELSLVEEFREASGAEIIDYEDVCNICLAPMTAARVTPCQHIFHSNCLRLCLKTGPTCPVCKRNLYKL